VQYIALTIFVHVLYAKQTLLIFLEEVFLWFPFNIFFYLGGNRYGIPHGTVVTGVLDMHPGKHDLHFLVDAELLPHAIVNIPNETMHIGVILYLFFYFHHNHFIII
jgi:hypothetical protein